MRWLILAAEFFLAIDGVALAVLYVLYRLAERRFDDLREVRDWELWAREVREYMASPG